MSTPQEIEADRLKINETLARIVAAANKSRDPTSETFQLAIIAALVKTNQLLERILDRLPPARSAT